MTESTQTPAPEARETQSTAPQETVDLAARVAELEVQIKEKEAKYLYLYADFDNYKKRSIKERSDLLKFGWENVAGELLQVIDNLECAIHHMPANADSNLRQGIQMVLNQFKATLEKQGVKSVEALKQAFDPNLHEAISHEPSNEHAPGVVVQEHVKGYTLHGRLLRPSRVVVSSGSDNGSNGGEATQ